MIHPTMARIVIFYGTVAAAALTATAAHALGGGPTTHPASSAAFILEGPEAQDWFGAAIGLADDALIVGAPVSDSLSPTKPGRAFVFDRVSGALVHTFIGEQAGDKFGAAVAAIGDLTGDGSSEFLVGAPGFDDGLNEDVGRAYVFSGATGQTLHVLTGEQAGDWFGFSAGRAGDVNGDGVGDFVVGARTPFNGRPGFAYVYSGATGQIIHVLEGEAPGTHFGFAVAGAPGHSAGPIGGSGDVNGDGFDDIVVGAPFHPAVGFFGGRAYVFSGSDGSLLHTFTGEAGSNFFGISVAIAGDVNGDGHADVLIGADANSAGGTNAGRAYVFSGKDGSLLHVFTGTEVRGRLGRGVSAAGDVNGDGHADLLVGQPAPLIAGGSGTGRAFIFSGASGDLLHEFIADEPDDFFGFSVAGAGGPGALIGAFASDVGGTQSGAAYAFSFGADGPVGDLNGDGSVGVADLLILLGSWGACPDCGDCPADLSGDCTVGVADLLILLQNWG